MLFSLVLLSLFFRALEAESPKHRRDASQVLAAVMLRQQQQQREIQQLSNLLIHISVRMERIEKRLYAICPTGYTRIEQSCYKIYMDKTDWFDARNKCQRDGSHLVAIETAAEQEAVAQFLDGYPDEHFWTSGNDLDGGHFVWNTTGRNFLYTNWLGNQPDNYHGLEHCVEMSTATTYNRAWNDLPCTLRNNCLTLCEVY